MKLMSTIGTWNNNGWLLPDVGHDVLTTWRTHSTPDKAGHTVCPKEKWFFFLSGGNFGQPLKEYTFAHYCLDLEDLCRGINTSSSIFFPGLNFKVNLWVGMSRWAYVPLVLQCTSHWSYVPLVLRPIGPTSHWSYAHWSYVPLVLHPIGPMSHWSFVPLVLRPPGPTSHWSYIPLGLHPIGPTSLWSKPSTQSRHYKTWSQALICSRIHVMFSFKISIVNGTWPMGLRTNGMGHTTNGR